MFYQIMFFFINLIWPSWESIVRKLVYWLLYSKGMRNNAVWLIRDIHDLNDVGDLIKLISFFFPDIEINLKLPTPGMWHKLPVGALSIPQSIGATVLKKT
jgi:hypothetical protein